MLEKSFGLFYYLKNSKNQKVEKRYVYLRITVDGERRDMSLKKLWGLDQWNSQIGRATGDNQEARDLNSYLDVITSKVYQAKINLLNCDKVITAERIKNTLLGTEEKRHFILEAFQVHNTQMKTLVGIDIAPATLTRYRTAYDHVNNFIKWKYGKEDLEVKDLDFEFISQFVYWLKTERHCGNNTAIKYLGNFKKIVLEWKFRKA